ncbi:MAG: hypothetical protein HY717_03110 [Planctomycetes bacterium]|nr:hypothetical protein [Planctomycetota bacterium]
MTRGRTFSLAEKLLLAAFRIEEKGKSSFAVEDLVVSAWKQFPDAFGLAGYRDLNGKPLYPDSERVIKKIISTTPIRKQGLLKKVGRRLYQLTEAGRDQARLLLSSGQSKSSIEKIALSRETVSALKKLFSSKVMDKFRNNLINEITFSDACSFWGISPRSSAVELEGAIANFEKIIATSKEASKDKLISFEHSGDGFGESDLEDLLQVHRELLRKFQNELSVIKQRTDERV